uniref:DUF5679 domain-containing protein n=1 Tax=viral metagenome TaxID=1070528 RepID=A0A6C0IZ60_9ZZZZ
MPPKSKSKSKCPNKKPKSKSCLGAKIIGYCMSCRKKMSMVACKKWKMGPSKVPAVSGKCSKCGCKMNKILKVSERSKV